MLSKLSWAGQDRGPVLVASAAELDGILTPLANGRESALPILLLLESGESKLPFVYGAPLGFVQIGPRSGTPPYLVAVGEREAEGFVSFMVEGRHETELPARHALPAAVVRQIVVHFLETGERLPSVEWTEL